jgi:hypothetical protein
METFIHFLMAGQNLIILAFSLLETPILIEVGIFSSEQRIMRNIRLSANTITGLLIHSKDAHPKLPEAIRGTRSTRRMFYDGKGAARFASLPRGRGSS